MKAFRDFGAAFADLDSQSVGDVILAASDIALIIDSDGVIRDFVVTSPDLTAALDGCHDWNGKSWRDIVTVESRPKLDGLLTDAGNGAGPRWRHLNHPTAKGVDVPILYSAIRLGVNRQILAMGRDLRQISNLQQRLVDAQQSLDQGYVRMQQLELRHRLLFQTAHEAIIIIDATSGRVLEANPAMHRLTGEDTKRIVGRTLTDFVLPAHVMDVRALLNAIRMSGRNEETRVKLAPGGMPVRLGAHLFRQESQTLCLVRVMPEDPASLPPARAEETRADLRLLVEHAPDAIVVTSVDGRIRYANNAFLELAQLAHAEQAQGETLDRWLGQPGVELGVLISSLRQRGSVRQFTTMLRGEHGISTDVEVSAVAVTHAGQPIFGFTMRNHARRWMGDNGGAPRTLPRSPEQLTELIGRVPLRDLVRETTDVIERLCIEAALELTGNNRASTAEILGLSRQSLYVKLRRFGIADSEGESDV